MVEDSLLTLRPMREGDTPFVVSTWVLSLATPHWMPVSTYRTNMRRSVALMLERSKRTVVLASREHDSTIMGWGCGDDGVIHHAYVRPELRTKVAGRAWIDALVHAAMGQ